VLDPSIVTLPARAAAEGSVDPGALAPVVGAAALGVAFAPGLLQAPIAMIDAKASAARRFEPEIDTKVSPLGRARARVSAALGRGDCCSLRDEGSGDAFNEGFVAR
jgi:hypothetical protein